jgi:hypothetical protein
MGKKRGNVSPFGEKGEMGKKKGKKGKWGEKGEMVGEMPM